MKENILTTIEIYMTRDKNSCKLKP